MWLLVRSDIACLVGGWRVGKKLNAIAPRVRRVEPAYCDQSVVPDDACASAGESVCEDIEVRARPDTESRMGFPGRREGLLHADMQLLVSKLKPHAASRS